MPTTATPSITIPEYLKQQFKDEGYFILEGVIPQHHLEILRGELAEAMDRIHAEMDKLGKDVLGINHRNSRYFVANCFHTQPRLYDFIFSDLMAEVCRATLGNEAYVFWEQYVVKAAEKGMHFSWHQDSGYVGYPDHKPYLTCWCPLDDVNEENGTVYLLPYSRSGIRSWVKHIQDPATNDLVGYFGKDKGIPVIAPAGSIVAFSSVVFHSSGHNRTKSMRRVYLPQYSAEVIKSPDGSRLWGNAVPFLKDGRRIDHLATGGEPVRAWVGA